MSFDRFTLGIALIRFADCLRALRLRLNNPNTATEYDAIQRLAEAAETSGDNAWDISRQCASVTRYKRSRRKLDEISIDLALLTEWISNITPPYEDLHTADSGLRRAESFYYRIGKYYNRPDSLMNAHQRNSDLRENVTPISKNEIVRMKFLDSLPTSQRSIPRRSEPKKVNTSNLATVSVLYATDRRAVENLESNHIQFEDGRGNNVLSYGVSDVSIPYEHKIGQLERPNIWKLQFVENQQKHVVITSCKLTDLDEWNALASEQIHKTGNTSALVFVHGYNVSFDEAIRRSAQIGFDMQFDGIISAYSWGSAGSLTGYFADEETVALSKPLFNDFLTHLRESVGVQTIHIVAHSMGNRLVVEAISSMPNMPSPILSEVVMAAPDIDASLFRAAVSNLSGKAARYTLYGSKRDKALVVSKKLRQGFPRAGDGGSNVVVINGVETIDASAVGDDLFGLGHGYFASTRSVLTDLAYLIRESLSASKRHGLRAETTTDGLTYWVFQP